MKFVLQKKSWEQFHFTVADIPELIRMATDEDLNNAMSNTDEVWAPLHAWRSLGQLGAAEAIQPLLGLLHRVDDDDDDWLADDLPNVFALIGQPAVAPVGETLADQSHGVEARMVAATALVEIPKKHPEMREACIAALVVSLENYEQNPKLLNGELAASLADLEATETYPLVEKAYAAGRVDEMVMGDWEDFQVEVGLLEERETPEKDYFPVLGSGFSDEPRGSRKEDKKTKQKRKQAKASRKKNRKRK